MVQYSCITAVPWGLSCQSAGGIKIALCAKYGDTKIELVEVDKMKRRCRFLWPRQRQRPGMSAPEALLHHILGSFLIPSGFDYKAGFKAVRKFRNQNKI